MPSIMAQSTEPSFNRFKFEIEREPLTNFVVAIVALDSKRLNFIGCPPFTEWILLRALKLNAL